MWLFALTAGLIVGTVDTLVMVPLPFPSREAKRTAMTAAFIERFFLGFVVGPVAAGLDANGILVGAALGLGFSVPTALITKSYVPIIALGLVGGVAVGVAYVVVY